MVVWGTNETPEKWPEGFMATGWEYFPAVLINEQLLSLCPN